jgi:hypothetical protein
MAARGQLVLSLVVVGGLLLPAVRQAEAADRYIVLLDIEGEKSPRLKKSIARMVKEQYKVMEGSSYRDAARRLRAQKLTPTNVKRVCGYLEADGVIDGTLVKEDGRYKFTLRVRSGVTGAIAKKIPMFINQPSLSQNMADQLEERLLSAIADLPRSGGGTKVKTKDRATEDEDEDAGFSKSKKRKGKASDDDEEEEEEDEPRKMTKAEKKAAAKKAAAEKKAAEKAAREEAALATKEALAAKKKKAREEAEEDEEEEEEEAAASKKKKKSKTAARDDEEEEEEEEEEEDEEPKRAAMKDAGDDAEEDEDDASADVESSVEKPRAPTSPRTTPLLINAGVSFVGRNLVFKHSAAADLGPRGYEGKTVPGVYATGELYPMAFTGAKGALANVGFGFVADRVVKLYSAVVDDMNNTTLLATRQSRYGANLRYRHNFGDGPRGLTITGFVGYNKLSFVIDRSNAPENVIVDVPNTAYSYVDPGVGARIPLVGPLSALIGPASWRCSGPARSSSRSNTAPPP